MTVEAAAAGTGGRWSPWLARLRSRAPLLAGTLAGLSGLGAVTAALGSALAGLSLADVVNGFVVTNTAIALSFTLCGLILATRRPANPIGWLFLADGLGHAITAASAPLITIGMREDWPTGLVRAVTTVGAYSWPWSIALFLPLALLLFPTGRLPGRRWRWVPWAAVATAPLFVVDLGTEPNSLVSGGPTGYLTIADHAALAPLWILAEIRVVLLYALCALALGLRYRRGDERERRQLLWPILATVITACVLVPWGVFLVGPVLMLLAIPLIGAAVTIAILRHQLLDIRLVFSRTVLYLLLTSGVVVTYTAVVAMLDSLLRRQAGLGVLATVLIAVGFNPVRVRLQRVVDRALYGSRSDPVRAVSQVSAHLVTAETGLGGVVEALRAALRLPFAALRGPSGEIASSGTAPEGLYAIPLAYGEQRLGELVVGARAGERRLDPADRAVLELLAAPLAVAVHATALSEELQRSRERLVSAREEERRRLRRDLHDGLGPTLTGVTLQADLARNLVLVEPKRAMELLTELRRQTVSAIEEIRRVAYGLRPPALDELGLLAALGQQVGQLDRRPGGPPVDVRMELPDALPALSAAAESAAYRITVEALSNALRHSGAGTVQIAMWYERDLIIEVRDDGAAGDDDGPWRAGVGLRSMHERAAELGGSCHAGPTADGGLVRVQLPLGTTT